MPGTGPARSYAPYLPGASGYCSHPGLVLGVSDQGIELGPTGELVRTSVTGGKDLARIRCRHCGGVGHALPRRGLFMDGRTVDPDALPHRDEHRPEPLTRGIPTSYGGADFRSRLEARWAAFFTLGGWRWVYEPVDAQGYIPDFLIPGAASFLIEVGPCVSADDYVGKAAKPSAYQELPTLVVGVAPVMPTPDRWSDAAGLLINEFPGGSSGRAYWHRCDRCGALAIHGDDILRPCRHDLSDAARRGPDVFGLWAQAGNAVQWRPR